MCPELIPKFVPAKYWRQSSSQTWFFRGENPVRLWVNTTLWNAHHVVRIPTNHSSLFLMVISGRTRWYCAIWNRRRHTDCCWKCIPTSWYLINSEFQVLRWSSLHLSDVSYNLNVLTWFSFIFSKTLCQNCFYLRHWLVLNLKVFQILWKVFFVS